MPLPTLTWEQRFLGSITTTNTPLGVLTAVRDYLATNVSPGFHWSVTTDGLSNTEGSAVAPYLEITSSANVGANPIKLLLAGSNSASFPANDCFYGGNAGFGDYRPSGNRQNAISVGIAPDGGTLSGPHTTANPYGTARWSGYVKVVEPLTTTAQDNMWIVDSSECLAVFFEGSDSFLRGFIAGAIIAPLTDAAGQTVHNGVGRTYGVATINAGQGLQNGWLQNPGVAQFLSNQSSTSNNNDQKYGQGISLCWDPDGNDLAHFAKWNDQPQAQGSTTGQINGSLTDSAGNIAAVPIPLVNRTNTTYQGDRLIGILRQIKLITPARARAVLQDAAGNDVGYAVSPSLTVTRNAFAFTQS